MADPFPTGDPLRGIRQSINQTRRLLASTRPFDPLARQKMFLDSTKPFDPMARYRQLRESTKPFDPMARYRQLSKSTKPFDPMAQQRKLMESMKPLDPMAESRRLLEAWKKQRAFDPLAEYRRIVLQASELTGGVVGAPQDAPDPAGASGADLELPSASLVISLIGIAWTCVWLVAHGVSVDDMGSLFIGAIALAIYFNEKD
jgi:hypothetical protein